VTTTAGNSTCSANISPSERWVHSLVRPAPRAFFHPDRQISQPPRAGPVKAGRVFAATRRALALTGLSTVARSSGSGWRPPQSAPGRHRSARQVLWKFKPLILREIHAAGNTIARTPLPEGVDAKERRSSPGIGPHRAHRSADPRGAVGEIACPAQVLPPNSTAHCRFPDREPHHAECPASGHHRLRLGDREPSALAGRFMGAG
jgi:hypothetical protein